MSVSVPSKYLDRKDSLYYGKELPRHLQDGLTKGILDIESMSPKESLRLAMEEHKHIQAEKRRRKESEGEIMFQLNNLERGKRLLHQSEKTANLFDKYKTRNNKTITNAKTGKTQTVTRMLPERVNDMINKVSTQRNLGTGIRRTRKRVRKNTTKRLRRARKINKKKRV